MNTHRKDIWICYFLGSIGFLCLFLYCAYGRRSGPWLGEDSVPVEEILIISSLLTGAFLAVLALIDLITRSQAASEIHPGVILTLGIILVLGSWAMPGMLETPLRANLTRCHAIMREMGAKIADLVEQTGETPSHIDSLFTDEEMLDPFAPDQAGFTWRKTGAKTGMISSVGPDQKQDLAPSREIILYSVTNGSFSSGDIVLHIPEDEISP